MRGTLVAAAVLASGCISDNFGIFIPATTDRYELPDNHIPAARLEEQTLATSDGEALAAILALQAAPAAAPTVVFLHGQGGNIDDAWAWVMRLWDRGYNVEIVDYRGYGKSTGEPTEAGLYLDADTLFADAAADARLDAARLVIWGYSLGTGVASHLAVGAPARALVLEAPFTSMTDMVEQSSPYSIPAAWYTDTELDTLGRVGDIAMPIVVAHGSADRRIPYWMGERVYAAAHDPKRFVRVEGAGHGGVLKRGGDAIIAAARDMDAAAAP